MSALVILEWIYSPSDFLEESIEIARDGYALTIANGKAEAKIDSGYYDENPSLRQDLHDELMNKFLATQLLNHRPFDLSDSSMVLLHPDGHKEHFAAAKLRGTLTTKGKLDFQVLDKNGNITFDSKRDRVERRNELADLLDLYRGDETLNKVLQSYNAAVRDPENEFVHLYEIRDALDKVLDRKLYSVVGVPSIRYRRFGELCCVLPLRQGRHRGRASELRDATPSELNEAREIARIMIEGYIRYLEKSA